MLVVKPADVVAMTADRDRRTNEVARGTLETGPTPRPKAQPLPTACRRGRYRCTGIRGRRQRQRIFEGEVRRQGMRPPTEQHTDPTSTSSRASRRRAWTPLSDERAPRALGLMECQDILRSERQSGATVWLFETIKGLQSKGGYGSVAVIIASGWLRAGFDQKQPLSSNQMVGLVFRLSIGPKPIER